MDPTQWNRLGRGVTGVVLTLLFQMAKMDLAQWNRLWEVFHRAREAPPTARDAILDELSAGDAALRAEVEELLDAGSSPLDRAPVAVVDHDETMLLCGRFEIVTPIGREGVYESLDRATGARVALRILRTKGADARARQQLYEQIERARQLTRFDLFEHRDSQSDDAISFVTMQASEVDAFEQAYSRASSR